MSDFPLYQRILLKLSGEALMGEGGFGLSAQVLKRMALDIKEVIAHKVQLGIVIGGGNFLRGANLAQIGMNRVSADHMGMLATVMNSLALQDALRAQGVKTITMSSIDLPGIAPAFQYDEALKHLENGAVVIFAGGTGNPFFTTDTAACLRGVEIGADVVFKATKVDGVYDKDPHKFTDAQFYAKLNYDEVLEKKLAVMDLTAIVLCQQHNMPLRVINMTKQGNLKQAIMSYTVGTLITSGA